jgi:hypothetical protein
MRFPGLVGGSSSPKSSTLSAARTVNWFVESAEDPDATSGSCLLPTPGVEEIVDSHQELGRAHFFENGREFAVIGSSFYEIDKYGTLALLGSVTLGAEPATISSNGEGGGQLLITSGSNAYIYDLDAGTFAAVSDMEGKATMGAALDGYFLILDASTSTLWVSDLLDGTSWDPTQYAQRSIASDVWVSMKVNQRYIWLMGGLTTEVWYDAGTFPFPFAPHPAGTLPYGCVAPFSPAVAHGVLYWLAGSQSGEGMVLRASGFSPEVISTYALRTALADYSTLTTAHGDHYDEAGHTFYLLTIPGDSAPITWTFDAREQLWTERGTWISEGRRYDAWRPRWHAFAFGEHRWLDNSSGKIYRSDLDLGTDVGDRVIRRMRRTPTLELENERILYAALELDLDRGLGLVSGQGSDPQVMLRWSDDGGKNWSSERWRSAGKIGEYNQRVRWNRLGSARRRAFEIVVTDPIPWRITGGYLRLGQTPEGLKNAGQMVA